MTMDAKLQELCRQAHEDRIRVGMLDTDTKTEHSNWLRTRLWHMSRKF